MEAPTARLFEPQSAVWLFPPGLPVDRLSWHSAITYPFYYSSSLLLYQNTGQTLYGLNSDNIAPASMDNFSAPFSQQSAPPNVNQFPQPNTSMNTPSTVAQTFSQNMASISANNILANQSRTQLNSPKVAQPGTPKQSQNQSQGQNTGPSKNPAHGPSQAQLQAQAQVVAREKIRVITLLDINSTLLQEITNLQAAGRAGSSAQVDGTNGIQAAQKPSQEYIDCMRRLQANLTYLASITDKQRRLPAPAILTPPPNTPTLNEIYKKLNDLFPRPGQGSTPQRASPGMAQGNGGPSPSPLPDPVV